MAAHDLPPACELVFQPSPDIMEQVFALRVQAWRARTSAFPEMDTWRDDFDDVAYHWVVLHQDPGQSAVAVAAARMTIHQSLAEVPNAEIYDGLLPPDFPGPIASINRLVVAKAFAGQGLPHVLDTVRMDFARHNGCSAIIGETFAGMRRHDDLLQKGFVALGMAKP